MSDDTLRSITVRIPEKTLVRLQKHAAKTGVSASALARSYLDHAAPRADDEVQPLPNFIGIGHSGNREPIDWNNFPTTGWRMSDMPGERNEYTRTVITIRKTTLERLRDIAAGRRISMAALIRADISAREPA